MALKRTATAPYPTNWDPPDLIDYKESTLSALWKGPKVLTSYFVNKIYDYQVDMKEGKGMLGFLFSDPSMGDGHQWEMVRPLGRGGFGSVGLWQRTKDGVVIDEMAIKQADHKPFLDVQDGLAREAVLQKQLNNRNNENILVLRRYKFYTSQRKYRFYLEFCPHGDLERLRSRYRAYRTHLPELFLWHLFKSLADVVSEMSQGPWTDLSGNHLPRLDASYMLHMDLKPVNVFLGYDKDTSYQGNDENPGPLSGYPTIKISDFGLANVTNSSDPGNPRDYWGNGTPNFIPPEQRLFAADWKKPPNHEQIFINEGMVNPQRTKEVLQYIAIEDAGFTFETAHNVWAIGKIMSDLLTLSEGNEFDDVQNEMDEQTYYNELEDLFPDVSARAAVYSKRLCDLVSRCCRLDVRKRPTPAELQELTNTQLKVQENMAINGETVAGCTIDVYFKRNEISALADAVPDGNFTVRKKEWHRLVNPPYDDRDWTPLVPNAVFAGLATGRGDGRPPQNFRPRPFNVVGEYVEFGDQPAVYQHLDFCNGNCGEKCRRALSSERQPQRASSIPIDTAPPAGLPFPNWGGQPADGRAKPPQPGNKRPRSEDAVPDSDSDALTPARLDPGNKRRRSNPNKDGIGGDSDRSAKRQRVYDIDDLSDISSGLGMRVRGQAGNAAGAEIVSGKVTDSDENAKAGNAQANAGEAGVGEASARNVRAGPASADVNDASAGRVRVAGVAGANGAYFENEGDDNESRFNSWLRRAMADE